MENGGLRVVPGDVLPQPARGLCVPDASTHGPQTIGIGQDVGLIQTDDINFGMVQRLIGRPAGGKEGHREACFGQKPGAIDRDLCLSTVDLGKIANDNDTFD